MFEVFIAAMLAAALLSLTVLFSHSSEGPTYLRWGDKMIRWDPPTRCQSGGIDIIWDTEAK